MQSAFLAAAERQQGLKAYLRYVFVNGLSFAFLSETIVIVLALQFGASNLQIGYLASAVYLTGFISIFVPLVLGEQPVMKVFYWAWFLRSFVGLGYLAVFWLDSSTAVWIILVTFTLYCVLRNSAYFLNQVVMAALAKRSELGRVSARNLIAINTSGAISRVISFLILSIPHLATTVGIAILTGIGTILNAAAAQVLRAVPVRDVVQKRGLGELFGVFARLLAVRETRVTLWLNLGGIALLVLFNFTQPFLQRIQGLSPGGLVAFSVCTAVALVLAGRFGQLFIDRLGSKPFLVAAHLILTALSLGWAWLPAATSPLLFFGLGLATMFCLGLVTMVTGRLVLALVPAKDRVGFSAILSLLVGGAALVAGIAGGLLADLHLAWAPTSYSSTFALMGLVALWNAIQSSWLVDKGSASFSETAKVLFSVPNLQTYLSIERLDHAASLKDREGSYLEIEYSSSDLASAEIGRRLHLPLMREKEMLIRSLFTKPRPELLSQLIDEALDEHSWWRQSAIFALGAYPDLRSREVLRRIALDDQAYIRSVAVKSLARIGDPQSLEWARTLLSGPQTNPRTILNALIALSLADRSGSWLAEIFDLADQRRGYRYQQHVLVIAGNRLGTQPGIEYFFYRENQRPAQGFAELIDEAREVLYFYESESSLTTWLGETNWPAIRNWCRDSLAQRIISGPRSYLAQAILHSRDQTPTATDTLAMLYFTYQLHRDGAYDWSTHGELPE